MAEFTITQTKNRRENLIKREKEIKRKLKVHGKDTGFLLSTFKEYNPISLLESIVGKRYQERFRILEYHIWFYQAMLLTVERKDWGEKIPHHKIVEKSISALERFSFLKLNEHIASGKSGPPLMRKELDNEKTRKYFNSTVKPLSKKHETQLFQPYIHSENINKNFKDLILSMDHIFLEFCFFSGKDLLVTLEGLHNEFENNLQRNSSLNNVIKFNIRKVSNLTGVSHARTRKILNELTFCPGDLLGWKKKENTFLLNNPVWECPGIKLKEDYYLFPSPPNPHCSTSRIANRLGREKIPSWSDNHLSKFLEKQLEILVGKSLPKKVSVQREPKWSGGKPDLVIIYDRIVLIIEAKSGKNLDKTIKEGSKQLSDLKKLIFDAKKGDENAIDEVEKLKVNPKKVDNVISVLVTLEELNMVEGKDSNKEKDVKNQEDIHYITSISDLEEILKRLDNHLLFYHYLSLPPEFHYYSDENCSELDSIDKYLEMIKRKIKYPNKKEQWRHILKNGELDCYQLLKEFERNPFDSYTTFAFQFLDRLVSK